MKDWLDCPTNDWQYIEEDCWCPRCREQYVAAFRFDNEVGEYYGDSPCPYCGRDGVRYRDQDKENDDDR